jgi:hypothetical protein
MTDRNQDQQPALTQRVKENRATRLLEIVEDTGPHFSFIQQSDSLLVKMICSLAPALRQSRGVSEGDGGDNSKGCDRNKIQQRP